MRDSTSFMQPDVTLSLDLSGVIQRAVLSNAIATESVAEWVGKAWVDTVGDAQAPVERMLSDAQSTGVSAFHWVNQRFPSGLVLPVEYTTVRLGGSAGLIAIGRSLEAVEGLRAGLAAEKVSMERDAWKMRGVETRHRLLFNAAAQPSLMIAANDLRQDLRIVESNAAATDSLGVNVGDSLTVQPDEQAAFRAMLATVCAGGSAPAMMIHLGAEKTTWLVRASLSGDGPAAVVVLRLSSASPAASQVQVKDPRQAQREIIRGKVSAIEQQVAQAVSDLTNRTRKS